MYLEDRRHTILQVATNANITICYNPKMHKRNYRRKMCQLAKEQWDCMSAWNSLMMTEKRLIHGTKELLYHIAGEDML